MSLFFAVHACETVALRCPASSQSSWVESAKNRRNEMHACACLALCIHPSRKCCIVRIIRPCLECGIFSRSCTFSCENELIPEKFLRNSCEIPAFQTCPHCFQNMWDLETRTWNLHWDWSKRLLCLSYSFWAFGSKMSFYLFGFWSLAFWY